MPRSSAHANVNMWREAQSHINELHLLLTFPTGRHGLGHWNRLSKHTHKPSSCTCTHLKPMYSLVRTNIILDPGFISSIHFNNETKQCFALHYKFIKTVWSLWCHSASCQIPNNESGLIVLHFCRLRNEINVCFGSTNTAQAFWSNLDFDKVLDDTTSHKISLKNKKNGLIWQAVQWCSG